MAACEFCSIVDGTFESEELYHDDLVIAVLHLKPASSGHILIFTKEHYQIIEQVPDYVIGHIFYLANKLSTVLFESLDAHGTNIIIENGAAAGQGIAHFSVHIIPRKENDGLKFDWAPAKVAGDALDIASIEIKKYAEHLHPSSFEFERKSAQKAVKEAPSTKKHAKSSPKAKQVRRIP